MPYVSKFEYQRLVSGLPRKPPMTETEEDDFAIVQSALNELEAQIARAEGYRDGIMFAVRAFEDDEPQAEAGNIE